MCRMLFASGNFNMDWVIQDLLLMASDQNEKHEKNRTDEFIHGDGWGIAYPDAGELKVFKSPRPIYKDSKIDQFRTLKTSLVILHARKASRGEVDIKNVHPFALELNGSRYQFFHNGTIKENLPFDRRFVPLGNTDSEALLYFLASVDEEPFGIKSLRLKLEKIKDLTAANCILSNGKISYFTCWYSADPIYYTLKVLKKPDFVCVASEILPHYRGGDWYSLENKSIFSVRSHDLELNDE